MKIILPIYFSRILRLLPVRNLGYCVYFWETTDSDSPNYGTTFAGRCCVMQVQSWTFCLPGCCPVIVCFTGSTAMTVG